jgi:hypothetical protein
MIGLFAAAAVLIAACGGDDRSDSDDPATTPAPASATETTQAAAPGITVADDIATEEGSSVSSGTNVAVVTIGEHRYEFDVTPGAIQRCDPDFFAAFWAIGAAPDGSGLWLLLPPPGDPNHEDPPTVEVSDETNDLDWVANPENSALGLLPDAEPGQSQVDSWDVDGNTVTGTATFIEENAVFGAVGGVGDAPEPVVGTFEVVCAGE